MRTALIVIAASLLVAATGAGAAPPRSIPVSPGDTIEVVGTRVGCFAVVSAGTKGLACWLADSKGLLLGTYGAAISQNGEVLVHKIDAKHPSRIFKRTLQQAGKHYYKVDTGDSFGFNVKGGSLGCKVIDVTTGAKQYRGKKVACWLATETAPFPNTYGIAVSDKFAGVFRLGPQGNVAGNVFVRFQPKA